MVFGEIIVLLLICLAVFFIGNTFGEIIVAKLIRDYQDKKELNNKKINKILK